MGSDTDSNIIERLRGYDFDFENIAFEGGGVKGVAHVGMIQVLHEVGVMKKVKRFAGTSAGAMIAAMASVGCTPQDMLDAFNVNLQSTMLDATFGIFSFIPNMLWKYGWNPGDRMLKYMDDFIAKKTGIKNITFRQVYENYGNELCVVATNVSTMTPEYFHPKTTPDHSISLAIKCSSSLPGYMQPPKVSFPGGMTNLMVDGGLSCAFPIYVFDGWFLSMDFANGFFKQMNHEHDRFKGFNPRTLGALLVAATDNENHLGELLVRARQPHRPDTKLVRSNGETTQKEMEYVVENQKIFEAGQRLFKSFQKSDENQDGQISFPEFLEALKKLSDEDAELLFGQARGRAAFDEIDRNRDEMIQEHDFFYFMQKKGLRYHAMAVGGTMKNIQSLGNYIDAIVGIATNMTVVINQKVLFQKHDMLRTIGINTDYVTTTDFNIDRKDTDFMVEQGRIATVDHLAWLVDKADRGELPDIYDGIITKKPAPRENGGVETPPVIGETETSRLDEASDTVKDQIETI